jgi:MFS superfamily sulfate permease-like transporter
VLLGTGTALIIHIANTSAPRLRVLRPERDSLAPVGEGEAADVVVVEVSGNLHYAAVAPFVDAMETIVPRASRVLVIDLDHAREIRFAALRAMEQLAEQMRRDGGALWLAGVDAQTARLLERSESPLPWVADSPTPGESIRGCLERIGSQNPEQKTNAE